MLRDFSLRDFGASLNTVESYTNESSQGKIGLCETANKQKCTHLGMFLASGDNDYVGIVGRTTIPNYEELDIPKYFGIKPFSKSMNIYGLYENYQTIQEKGYTVILEAEKSVLKRYSRKDGTAVAIGSHTLSDEQVKILIGLNVDIVIAYDEGISINEIRKECEKFYGIRNVYYIYDKWGILNEKESPADKPNKQYEFMLKYKVKYDDSEHKELIKWLNEKPKRN